MTSLPAYFEIFHRFDATFFVDTYDRPGVASIWVGEYVKPLDKTSRSTHNSLRHMTLQGRAPRMERKEHGVRKSIHVLTVMAVVTALCFLLTGNAAAQVKFELGVKAGLGLAKITGDDNTWTEGGVLDLGDGFYATGSATQAFDETKVGFVGGVYATAQVNDRFGVRLEGLYTKKGGKGKNSGELDIYDPSDTFLGSAMISGENTLTLDYFEIPLLAVFSFPVSPTATFDVFAGPALAFNTKAEWDAEFVISMAGDSEKESEKIDMKDNVEGMDFGGVLGAGVSFELPSVVLFGEARWTYGFKEIDKSTDQMDIKNSAFGFMVGVGIPLAKTP